MNIKFTVWQANTLAIAKKSLTPGKLVALRQSFLRVNDANENESEEFVNIKSFEEMVACMTFMEFFAQTFTNEK